MMTEAEQILHQWLAALGGLCAAHGRVEDAQEKLRLYVPHLMHEFPVAAFTQQSLRHVARRCKFFPTFGELCDALSEHWRSERPSLPSPTRGIARESPEPYKLPPPPSWCFNRGLRGEDSTDPNDRDGLKRIAALLERAKLQPRLARHLTPEQLDQINPLPNGYKRASPKEQP